METEYGADTDETKKNSQKKSARPLAGRLSQVGDEKAAESEEEAEGHDQRKRPDLRIWQRTERKNATGIR